MIDLETVRTAVTRTACRAADRAGHIPRFAGVPDETNPDAVTIVIGSCSMSFTGFVEQLLTLYPAAPFIVAATFGRLLDVPSEPASVTVEDLADRTDVRIGVMTAVIEGDEMTLWATLRSVADDGSISWGEPYLASPRGPWSGSVASAARRHAAGN